MFWKFVSGALRLRIRRLSLAFLSLAVAATLATALFSIYSGIEQKVSREFQGYGANLIISPSASNLTVPLTAVTEAERAGAIAVPFLFTTARLNNQPVIVSGIDFAHARPLIQYWHVDGASSAGANECLAGAALAARQQLVRGSLLAFGNQTCTLRGIVTTGGSEENQLIVSFADAARISGISDAASLVQVRVPGDRLAKTRTALQAALPEADVRLVQAVADTEASVVLKVRLSFFLLAALILAITTLSVSSNFGELVLERSREIGILKAIGGRDSRIARFFVAESTILAAGSAVIGYGAGVLVAAWIARSIFDGPFAVHASFGVLALVTAVTLSIALIATSLATGRIRRIHPAIILRGE